MLKLREQNHPTPPSLPLPRNFHPPPPRQKPLSRTVSRAWLAGSQQAFGLSSLQSLREVVSCFLDGGIQQTWLYGKGEKTCKCEISKQKW